MADKPYVERAGGRYVRDKQTGRTTKAPEPREAATPAATAGAGATEPKRSGKKDS